MLKTFIQIIAFLLVLVYIGARVGMLSTQIRNAKKSNFEVPEQVSHIPDSVWLAHKYVRTLTCDTLGLVRMELKTVDRSSGRIQVIQTREAAEVACQFNSTIHLEWQADLIKVHLPLGSPEGEARCPSKCRYYSPFRTKIEPIYTDTTIKGAPYKLLQIKGFEVGEL